MCVSVCECACACMCVCAGVCMCVCCMCVFYTLQYFVNFEVFQQTFKAVFPTCGAQ